MANKKMTSSTGYFNKEMQAILKKGESKKGGSKKSSEKKKVNK